MIKFENTISQSPDQWQTIIMGARNPLNSWARSDSGACNCFEKCFAECKKHQCEVGDHFYIGPNDLSLMMKLRNAGTDHRKFMRMITVYVTITAPLYWWKEFDTYKIATVANSCSTMHKIHAKEFTLEDFSCEHLTEQSKDVLNNIIEMLNMYRALYISKNNKGINTGTVMSDECYANYKKDVWWQMIQLLPSSYNQKRTVMLNYEVLANMYKSRKDHKLDEWHEFCDWILELPYSELITGED